MSLERTDPTHSKQPGDDDRIPSPKRLRNAVLHGSALTISAQGVRVVATLVSAAVLGRLLTPEEYGAVGIALAFNGFVIVFRDLGLVQAATRVPELSREAASSVFWINTFGAGLCTIIIAALSPVVGWLFDDPTLTLIALALAPTALIAGLGGQARVDLNRRLEFGRIAVADAGPAVLGAAGAVLAAIAGAGVWALVINQWIVAAARTIWTWVASGFRPGRHMWSAATPPILRHGVWLTISEFFYLGQRNLQRLILGGALGKDGLGQFDRAATLTEMPVQFLFTPLSTVAIPTLATLQHDARRFGDALLRMAGVLDFISAPIAAIAIAAGPDALLILLGPGWEEASNVAWILAVPLVAIGSSRLLAWTLVVRGLGAQQVALQAIGSVLELAGVLIGLRYAGLVGAAAGLVAAQLAIRAPRTALALRSVPLPVRAYLRVVAPSAIAAVAGATSSVWAVATLGIDNLILSAGLHAVLAGAVATLVALASPTTRAFAVDARRAVAARVQKHRHGRR